MLYEVITDCKLGAPIFDHVTVANNTPGGLYFDTRGYPQIINSIVSSNVITSYSIHYTKLYESGNSGFQTQSYS